MNACAGKDYCPRGHKLAGQNLQLCKGGKRRCRTCAANWLSEYRRVHGRASQAKTKQVI